MIDERLHGGAQRLPLRWLADAAPPVHLSRYKIEPGESCALHVHTGKAECWLIVEGSGVAEVGADRHQVSAGDAVLTDVGVPHSLTNTGQVPIVFINIVIPRGGDITTRELIDPPLPADS